MALFVKFCKYNEYTLQNLILNQIRFSRVYDFNDFNELRYSGPLSFDTVEVKNLKQEVEKLDLITLAAYIKDAYTYGNHRKSFLKEFVIDKLKIDNLPILCGKYPAFFAKMIAFQKVGIFCCSSINIFKGMSPALMLAHYADNLKGLALIYEIEDKFVLKTNIDKHGYEAHENNSFCTLKKVIYNDLFMGHSGGDPNRVIDWCNNNYSSTLDFLYKYKDWEYEHEYRLFCIPGNQSANLHKIKLKKILFTSRFTGNIDILQKINADNYGSSILIQEISHSTEGHFKIDNMPAYDWITQ